MERLRSADPLDGRLPDRLDGVLEQIPLHDSGRIRGRVTRRLRLVAAGGLAVLVGVGAAVLPVGEAAHPAAQAYAAVTPGDGVVHLVMDVQTFRGERLVARDNVEMWRSARAFRNVWTERRLTDGARLAFYETAVSEASWQQFNSSTNGLLFIEGERGAGGFDAGAPGGLDPVAYFRRLYRAGRIVEGGQTTFDGRSLMRLRVGDAPDHFTFLVDPKTADPFAAISYQRAAGGRERRVMRFMEYERLPLTPATREALRMRKHPGADVTRVGGRRGSR